MPKYLDENGLEHFWAAVKERSNYYTPEDFGAKGDGTTDDSAAFRSALAATAASDGAKMLMLTGSKTYKCDTMRIDASKLSIVGNGAVIDCDNKSAFVVSRTVHDLRITGIEFSATFTVGDTSSASNSCIGIEADNGTEEFNAYNIEIDHCKFTCGVFGISGTSVQNLHVHDCEFYGAVYRPEAAAGGYAILTQSCSNVTIERCYFKLGTYSRHDIYVSVSPAKTAYVSNRNYRISNCMVDKSLITEHTDDAFYSPSILSVAVRSTYNLIIENYRVYDGTGLVFFTGTDGAIVNAVVRNCINDSPRYKASSVMANEMRQSFGSGSVQSGSDIKFEKCVTLNNSTTDFNDYTVVGGYIEVCDTTLNARIDVGDCEFLHLHDLYVKGSYLRFTGTGVLHGKFHSLDSDGNYIFGSASHSSDGAYIDINAYDDKLLGPWGIASSGALTFVTGKLHIAASGTAESNNNGTIVSLNYSQRPTQVTRAMSLSDASYIEVNVASSSLASNQLRIRKLNLSDGSAASTRTCRFYLC